MKVKHKGKLHELTTELVMTVGSVTRRAARKRIQMYTDGTITVDQLLHVGPYAGNSVTHVRDKISMTSSELLNIVKDISLSAANKRLKRWVAGDITYDALIAPINKCRSMSIPVSRNYGSDEWQKLGDFDRIKPEDINITSFERKVGEEMERSWGYVDA